MASTYTPPQLTNSPAAPGLTEQLANLATLEIEAARQLWRQTFQRPPSSALPRDIILRMLAYRLQEQQLGGLQPAHAKLLDRLAQGGSDDVRRLKIGTMLVRAYQGVLHEVRVVSAGFEWQGATYASLSNIARAITGTSWNGPRFFGLRDKPGVSSSPAGATDVDPPASAPTRRGRRGSVQARAA